MLNFLVFLFCNISIKRSRLKWAGHLARLEDDRVLSTFLVGKSIGLKEILGRPRRRWEDNIRMDLGI